MKLIKQAGLYLLGAGLLIFGNRKTLDGILVSLDPPEEKDHKKFDETFETQKITRNKENKLANEHIYFQTIHIDERDMNATPTRKTNIESDHAETASASQ
tara:strand:+ start:647 stop:946 length:300 start_codon:yes stop_codon:yes gene_type:complete